MAVLDVVLPDGSCEAIAKELDKRAVPFVVHSGAPAGDYVGTSLARGYWMPKPAVSSEIADRALNVVRMMHDKTGDPARFPDTGSGLL